MKVEIQGFWGAKVKTVKNQLDISPEEFLKNHADIVICNIAIDGKVWKAIWNGKELFLQEKL